MNQALKTFIFRAIIMFVGSILFIPGNYAVAQDLEAGLAGVGRITWAISIPVPILGIFR